MDKRTPKARFLTTSSLALAGALFVLPFSPALDVTGFSDHAALAAPGGNGNGNANGHGKENGGPGNANAAAGKNKGFSDEEQDELSASEKAHAKNEDRKAFHEAIKDLADLLGGRVNAMHSVQNGKTSNAAPHSAAGLAAAYAEAVEALFADDEDLEAEEEEEATGPTAGELLGSLANSKTTPAAPEDEEAEDELASAIQSFNDALANLNSEEDAAELSDEEQAEADAAAEEISREIADDTRETMDAKEGDIGLGAVKDGLFGEDEEEGGEEEES